MGRRDHAERPDQLGPGLQLAGDQVPVSCSACAIAASIAATPAAGPWLCSQTALITARNSAPAATSGAQLPGVMPPMATAGIVMMRVHQDKVSISASGASG